MTTIVESTTIILPDSFVTDRCISSQAAIGVEKLAQRVLQEIPVALTNGRVHDAITSLLPASAASDDLGIDAGSFGTNCPELLAGDLKAAGATTRYARFQIPVPDHYQDGETIQLRLRCAMETTVADTTCTVDCEARKSDGAGSVSAELVTTAAATMNSLTPADVDFTIDASGVDPGDLLDVRIAVACNDAATGTAVTPVIYSVSLLCDTRG